jgi:hypothetical protein
MCQIYYNSYTDTDADAVAYPRLDEYKLLRGRSALPEFLAIVEFVPDAAHAPTAGLPGSGGGSKNDEAGDVLAPDLTADVAGSAHWRALVAALAGGSGGGGSSAAGSSAVGSSAAASSVAGSSAGGSSAVAGSGSLRRNLGGSGSLGSSGNLGAPGPTLPLHVARSVASLSGGWHAAVAALDAAPSAPLPQVPVLNPRAAGLLATRALGRRGGTTTSTATSSTTTTATSSTTTTTTSSTTTTATSSTTTTSTTSEPFSTAAGRPDPDPDGGGAAPDPEEAVAAALRRAQALRGSLLRCVAGVAAGYGAELDAAEAAEWDDGVGARALARTVALREAIARARDELAQLRRGGH